MKKAQGHDKENQTIEQRNNRDNGEPQQHGTMSAIRDEEQ